MYHSVLSLRRLLIFLQIPPMKAGDAVLEVVFEVDVNGILKVTATEKTSGRSANITISNSVGKLNAAEIEKMVDDAAKFKTSDEAFSKKFEARQQLESYISRVEEIVSDPTMNMKLKRGQKEKIESALSDAMAQLEVDDAGSDDLKKKELALKRVVTKVRSLIVNDQQQALTFLVGHVYSLNTLCDFETPCFRSAGSSSTILMRNTEAGLQHALTAYTSATIYHHNVPR